MRKKKVTAAAAKKLSAAQKLLSVDNKMASEIIMPVQQRDIEFAEPLKFEITHEKKEYFSKEKAFKFLELETFEGERDPRQTWVQFLYDEWQAGRFLWHNVTLASCVLNGKEYRINGQHTSWMRVNIPDSKEPVEDAYIQFRQYTVKDSEQLRALYSAFDRNAPRTTGHITKVLLLDTEAGHGIPGSYFGYLSGGFRVFQYPRTKSNRTVNVIEMIELIKRDYSELFGAVGAFFKKHEGDARFLKRAAVLGAVFATFEKGVMKGVEFWEPVVTGIGLEDRCDPRHQLRRFMENHAHSISSKNTREQVSQEQMFRVCINAWNHWRSNRLIDKLKIPKTDNDRDKVKS